MQAPRFTDWLQRTFYALNASWFVLWKPRGRFRWGKEWVDSRGERKNRENLRRKRIRIHRRACQGGNSEEGLRIGARFFRFKWREPVIPIRWFIPMRWTRLIPFLSNTELLHVFLPLTMRGHDEKTSFIPICSSQLYHFLYNYCEYTVHSFWFI